MGILKEFMDFVKKQNIVSVALGLIIGFAAKTLIDALVADIISPLYVPYIGLDAEAAVTIGLSTFKIGHFLDALVSFLVIMLVAFVIAKSMKKKL
ncbi:MAG: MscL family protein [Candidatus Aenigmarchaeota archaeon]|nr:MscL family protein [Candidatus Aenigmarchaeota archaeon]